MKQWRLWSVPGFGAGSLAEDVEKENAAGFIERKNKISAVWENIIRVRQQHEANTGEEMWTVCQALDLIGGI